MGSPVGARPPRSEDGNSPTDIAAATPQQDIFRAVDPSRPQAEASQGTGAGAGRTAADDARRPFNIILVTEPLQGQSEDQRREVRAHAMRDYHKRKKRTIPRTLPPLRQRPPPRPFVAASEEARRPGHQSSGSHGSQGSQQLELDIEPQSPNVQRSRRSQLGAQLQELSFNSPIMREHPSGLPEFDRWQYDTSTPYAICMGSGAPTLYMQARRWPFVRHACGATPGISLWMPEMLIPMPSAYAQRPCLLKSAKTVPWISRSLEYLEFKGETMKWINQRLGDQELGPSEATIGVIMCLANWEIARGDAQELEHHMTGLQKIVQFRGGIDSLATIQHFQFKIALVDLLVAALNITTPRFPPFFIPQPHLPPPKIQGLDRPPIPDNPLFGTLPLEDALEGSPFGERGIRLLQRMRDLTNAVLGGTNAPSSADLDNLLGEDGNLLSKSAYAANLSEFDSLESPFDDDEYDISLLPHLLLTPLIHAATIYTRVLSPFLPAARHRGSRSTLLKPFSSAHNSQPLEALVQALQFPTNDATFTQYPGILVWILLVAAVAAEGRDERGFLVLFLARVGTGSGYGWWGEMRETIETFRSVRKIVG